MTDETDRSMEAESSTAHADATPTPAMSKNAAKKAARLAKLAAQRPEKRAAERARRKERDQAMKQGYADGTLTEEQMAQFEKRRELKSIRKREPGPSSADWPGGVIIDLGFDDLMTDIEISSMVSQLSYVYSCNRTAPKPVSAILHTSFSAESSPRLHGKMEKANWEKWTRSHWSPEGLDGVVKAERARSEAQPEASNSESTSLDSPLSTSAPSGSTPAPRNDLLPWPPRRIVYLSADAEDELTTLSPDDVYVIGGIVDRNRHKMLCQNKAEILGIHTARLPIGKYLENLPTRKVLTVNQVFEILVQYLAVEDWAKALDAVIPQRKYHEGKRRKLEGGGDRSEEPRAAEDDASDISEDEEAAFNM